MISNYFKIAIRNIQRNKLYASLNIIGLSIGLASFFIIYLFIQNELDYDKFHPDYQRIYRLVEETTHDFGIEKAGGVSAAIAPAVQENIPEVIAFSRADIWPKNLIIPGVQDSLRNAEGISADKGLLDFFALEFVMGSKETSFREPNSVLLSQSSAASFFGDENALGKTIIVNGILFEVDGVFKDLPKATSLKADVILPFETANGHRSDSFTSWGVSYFDLSLLFLAANADIREVEAKINALYEEKAGIPNKRLSLEPLSEVHFSLDTNDAIRSKTDKQYILIFTLVAFFILICSVFNYISLALAQSIQRAKEVGVRKVIGASKGALYRQFISESIMHVTLGYVLALIFVEATVPQFEGLIEREINFSLLAQPLVLLQGLLFAFVVAILSALYPAYLSTRKKVVNIFKSTNSGYSSQKLINGISILQVVVFIVLISVTFTANRQMHFMQGENLGFDKELQLILPTYGLGLEGKSEFLKNELLKNSAVANATYASSVPGRIMGTTTFGEYKFRWYNFDVDKDYLDVMGMTLSEGRGFLPEDSDSSNLVLINQTAAAKLNFEDSPVGKTLKRGRRELRIIGVVNDFHFASKKQPVEATLFGQIDEARPHGVLALKLNEGNLKDATSQVEATLKEVLDKEPFYFFLEDQINSQYKQENVMITVINTFTVIAALVAFIGIFGISGYSARRRLKEMGIRKVLGAGFMAIQASLNRSSIGRLILAILIGVPVVVYWMDYWLSTFAYQIDMPYGTIAIAVLIATLVVFLTMSFHSIKTFFINPAEILKDE